VSDAPLGSIGRAGAPEPPAPAPAPRRSARAPSPQGRKAPPPQGRKAAPSARAARQPEAGAAARFTLFVGLGDAGADAADAVRGAFAPFGAIRSVKGGTKGYAFVEFADADAASAALAAARADELAAAPEPSSSGAPSSWRVERAKADPKRPPRDSARSPAQKSPSSRRARAPENAVSSA